MAKNDESKLYAFLATFLSIVGFIIALVAKKKDSYVMFYAKQSLIVFIVAFVAGIIQQFFWFIPVFGWFISSAISVLLLILWIMSWVYALSGAQKEVPVVGHLANEWFKF